MKFWGMTFLRLPVGMLLKSEQRVLPNIVQCGRCGYRLYSVSLYSRCLDDAAVLGELFLEMRRILLGRAADGLHAESGQALLCFGAAQDLHDLAVQPRDD